MPSFSPSVCCFGGQATSRVFFARFLRGEVSDAWDGEGQLPAALRPIADRPTTAQARLHSYMYCNNKQTNKQTYSTSNKQTKVRVGIQFLEIQFLRAFQRWLVSMLSAELVTLAPCAAAPDKL